MEINWTNQIEAQAMWTAGQLTGGTALPLAFFRPTPHSSRFLSLGLEPTNVVGCSV